MSMSVNCNGVLVKEGYYHLKLDGVWRLVEVWYHPSPDGLVYHEVGDAIPGPPEVRHASHGEWVPDYTMEDLAIQLRDAKNEFDQYVEQTKALLAKKGQTNWLRLKKRKGAYWCGEDRFTIDAGGIVRVRFPTGETMTLPAVYRSDPYGYGVKVLIHGLKTWVDLVDLEIAEET